MQKMSERTIHRTSDGVPKYDGTPELLTAYREEALQYLMTFEYRKRYLVGPRLAKELEGTARVAIRTNVIQNPQWLSHPRGVYTLLQHLEDVIAKPSLPEASRFVMKFFYNLQWRKQETMTSLIARHGEALWEASQALRKVEKDYGAKSAFGLGHLGRQSRGSSNPTTSHASWRQSEGPFRDDGRLEEDEEEQEEGGQDWWQDQQWQQWGWREWQPSSDWSTQTWHTPEYDPPESWDRSNDIFIPEFLARFLLLHRSGLDAHERSNVLAAIRGEFSTASVAKALREQWSDDDLMKRDRMRTNSAMVADEEIEMDTEAFAADGDESDLDHLDAADKEIYLAEQSRVDEALAAIQMHKNTLREARWKQKQVKLGRGFFPPKPFQKGSAGAKGSGSRGKVECFRCGGNHYSYECTKPKDAKVASEAAHIAFGAWEIHEEDVVGSFESGKDCNSHFAGHSAEEAFQAKEVIDQCMGIIDSGATSSLGSIEALQAVQMHNMEHQGSSGMTVDLNERPVFRFGNGDTKGCISTVQVELGAGDRAGTFKVHVHDSPNQPVLISRKALKSLKAVIDFEEGTVVYKAIDPRKVVRLREAENGHLLMPLTGNLVSHCQERQTPFVSLFE